MPVTKLPNTNPSIKLSLKVDILVDKSLEYTLENLRSIYSNNPYRLELLQHLEELYYTKDLTCVLRDYRRG